MISALHWATPGPDEVRTRQEDKHSLCLGVLSYCEDDQTGEYMTLSSEGEICSITITSDRREDQLSKKAQ